MGYLAFSKNAQNTAPASKNQGFSCQEGIEIIKNREQNPKKNRVIEKYESVNDIFPILQPFWIVLVRFWGILAHFWSPWGVTKELQNQNHPNKAQLLNPQKAQEGCQGRFWMELERCWDDF